MKFRNDQIERYARHIILPQVGGRGQRRLLDAKVFVAGAGGLGSPIILYLAAAGVGTIIVADDDEVSLSNLQRQVLHTTTRIGEAKTVSAARTVAELNPDVHLVAHKTRLDASNVRELISGVDVVLDGTDNFPTRYLLNDACQMERKPLVSGAIFQFEGQVAVFRNDGGDESPCYRCLFSEPPPPGAVPSCQEAGVFGAIAGIVGTIQATEALKLVLDIGEVLSGRLLMIDALAMKFREIRVRRDAACALCGTSPTIRELVMLEDPQTCRPEDFNG